jgi:hypothetical protein
VFDRQGGRSRKVSDAPGKSLPPLRAQPGIHAKVWTLPNLFPRVGVDWSTAWRNEVELVAVRSDQRSMDNETVRRADG